MKKILCVFFALFWASSAAAQEKTGTPVREIRPEIEVEQLILDVELDGQQASVTLKTVFKNTSNRDLEVDYLAPLPLGGAVSGVTLLNNNQELTGQVYDKNEAFEIYAEIAARALDPALIEYAGQGLYRARVFPVPAQGRSTLELRLNYLPPKDQNQVAFAFPLAGPLTSGLTVGAQEVHIRIKNAAGLSNLYSPVPGAVIEERGPDGALFTWKLENSAALPVFRLFYQLDSGPLGGMLLSHKPDQDEDGFFMFLADPEIALDRQQINVPKNVIFVLDRSGSMDGEKFKQARAAVKFVLERLRPADNFNLVDYNDAARRWRPELMEMSPANRQAALEYLGDLRSGGGTNIEEALTTAFTMIGDPQKPNYILFMTDGQPTVGETGENQLAEIIKKANPEQGARVFVFGVGYDVNSRLLDRLSGQAGGTSVFVNDDENIESKVSSFFAKMDTPALTQPALTISRKTNRLLPAELPDLFAGQQLVVVGRYPQGGPAEVVLEGILGERKKKYVYQAALTSGPAPGGQFIAQLWAQRRIAELIDMIDLAGGRPNPELVEELISLSKRYGILTPYTSFLALENQDITRTRDLLEATEGNLSAIAETTGQSAQEQRVYKAEMMASAAPAAPPVSAAGAALPQQPAQDLVAREAEKEGFKMLAPGQWADKTFFFKDGQWQDAVLTEKEMENPKRITQMSPEYFTLARELAPEQMIWLSQKEPVILKIKDRVYLVTS